MFSSDNLLPAIGVTMVVETTIESGATLSWIAFTLTAVVVWVVANYLYEDTGDMVEDIHNEFNKQ